MSTEVLLKIFSFLDKSSCSKVARTCKKFKEPALDRLWREITTLTALLGLLDELTNTGSGVVSADERVTVDGTQAAELLVEHSPNPDVP